MSYFSTLNYTLANEDTNLEFEIINTLRPKKIVSVCGSGGRALPLMHQTLESMIIADLSQDQIKLAKLRLEAVKQLEFEDFLCLLGFNGTPSEREKIFLKLTLSKDLKDYWHNYFIATEYAPLIYQGKWEKTFIVFSKFAKYLLGTHCEKIFSFESLSEQKKYLNKNFPKWRWYFLIFILGNKAIFNALLYRGSFIKKNVPASYFEYYNKAFNHLFNDLLARNNFFLQMCLLGKIAHASGYPVEARQDVFKQMKQSANTCQISFEQLDIIATIKKQDLIDFISISDVPSYFSGKIEHAFLQEIKPHLSIGGLIVVRSYLRVPDCDRTGFVDVSSEYQEQISQECVGMYLIEILKRVS